MMTESRRTELAEYESAAESCPARNRLTALFDDGVFTETGTGAKNGENPAGVVTAYGYIGGCPAYAFSQDTTVMSGAVSAVHSAKICRMLELAARNGVPVVGIYDSCGAFINDGADALNAYSDMLLNIGNISGVVPVVSVISGVCSGAMAMIACSADFTVMTEGAELYMSANADRSGAEYAAECGTVSMCAPNDEKAMEAVRRYLSLMPPNNLSPVPEFEFEASSSVDFSTPESAAESIADTDSLLEISSAFGKGSYTALCTVNGSSAGIAAVGRNGGRLNADDCAKLSRFVRICDAYGLPVITVVDTEGFDLCGAEAARACAKLSGAYAEAVCPKITLISGKAYGAAFIAFAGKNCAADEVLALPDAVIAPLDPMTAAEFLYHDKLKGAADLKAARQAAADEYAEKEASAFAAAAKGAVNDIVTSENARTRIASVLDVTAGKRLSRRLPKKHSILPL